MGDSVPPKALSQPMQPTVPATIVPAHGAALPTEDEDRFDAGSALLRLLIGGMLVGADQLQDRLRRWDERSLATDAVALQSPQTVSATMRRALIGAAFESQALMRRRFSTMMTRLAGLADDANLIYTRLAFAVRGTPLDAVRRQLDELLFLALTAVDRWTERGQSEEQHGRQMAEQAAVSVIDELLDYMARNPEVRKLIEQQGMSVADSAVGEVRERTASADQWIERIAHNLLHRSVGGTPANSEGGPDGALPPATVQGAPIAARTRTKAHGTPARMPAATVEAQGLQSSDPG